MRNATESFLQGYVGVHSRFEIELEYITLKFKRLSENVFEESLMEQ